MDDFIEVIKWIGIVLAAGFIGYFGRHLAMLIIDRMRKKQPKQIAVTEPSKETYTSPEIQLEESRLKLEKKRAKAEAKRLKKAKDKKTLPWS
ncbi:hypothetical protein ACFLWZ_08845 [Chloroflexota bacterium]